MDQEKTQKMTDIVVNLENFFSLLTNWYQQEYGFISFLKLSGEQDDAEKLQLFQRVFGKELLSARLQQGIVIRLFGYSLPSSPPNDRTSLGNDLILFVFAISYAKLQGSFFQAIKGTGLEDIYKKAWVQTAHFFGKCQSLRELLELYGMYSVMKSDGAFPSHYQPLPQYAEQLEHHHFFETCVRFIREKASATIPVTKNQLLTLLEKDRQKFSTPVNISEATSTLSAVPVGKQRGCLGHIVFELFSIIFGSVRSFATPPPAPPSEEAPEE